jgi:hypothetical protein
LIPLNLLVIFPVISSAVFLSVRPSLIAVGFGSSFQLLSCGFSFRHDGGEGGRWKKEEGEGGRRSGRARVTDQKYRFDGTGFHALKYLSVGSTMRRRSGCAGGSSK